MKILKTAFLLTCLFTKAYGADFYVSTNGVDTNLGTVTKPFLTIQRARDAAREAKGSFVIVLPGTYYLKQTLELDDRDSGTKIIGSGGVHLSGGVEIPASAIKPVTDSTVLERLLPEVKDKVREVDLKRLGITDFGEIGPRGFGRPYVSAPLELFIDGEPMSIAQWPKAGQKGEPIGKVIDPGVSRKVGSILPHGGTFEFASDRPLRWTKSDDIWISGLFHYGYADDTLKVKSIDIDKKTITSEQAHGYGFSTGKPWNRWTALNLLEEIQLPGEFVADKRSGKLYFLPPDKKDVTSKSVYEVSVLKDPLISVKGASAVILEGLFIECSRGTGVCIVNGTNNHIQKCTFRNLGVLAVTLGKGSPVVPSQSSKWDLGDIAGYLYGHPLFNSEAGTDNGIVNCSIYNIGAGAISLAGGDRSSLQPGRNFVENCDIHHFNRWDRTYRSAVNIYGVGNIVRHCTIHDCPGSAILLHGNDHLIEYNEIYHALYDADDMGAFYMGRDPTERGNVFRYNYIHEVAEKGHVQCMYFDDNGGEGSLVYGNIFRHAGSTCVIYVNGGSDITIDNNIFIDCVDVAHVRWRDDLLPSIESGRFQQILQLTPYKESPWKEKYPQLLDYEANRKTLPRRQMIKNNLLVNSKPASKGTQKEENNWSTNGNPGFVDFNNGDYTLTGFADVFHHIPGFKAIPMDRIGISK